jgi:hypothetical protein
VATLSNATSRSLKLQDTHLLFWDSRCFLCRGLTDNVFQIM